MTNASIDAAGGPPLTPAAMQRTLAQFFPPDATTAERTALVAKALRSPAGALIRNEGGRWIVDQLVPVASLVPKKFGVWREPTRASMLFVISKLSVERLAPKLVEQYELPQETSPEARLLRLIAKVPGLQKLGQVLARNRHLRRSVRRALAKLENGIRDVAAGEIHAVIRAELGAKLQQFDVKMERGLLSEASVSAVVRFTWWNEPKQRREKGVFKVLKPHIPACFAEDMQILQELADYFGRKAQASFASAVIPDTFGKIRRHLQHEVDFPGEQAALVEGAKQFKAVRGVRVPRLFPQLCTAKITAMTEEEGVKVTVAAARMKPDARARLAQQLAEALVAFPLLSRQPNAIFHADPHAGNLLYNRRSGELVLLDWALAQRLTREQRRRLILLFLAVAARNRAAAGYQIEELKENGAGADDRRIIDETVRGFMQQLPNFSMPKATDAMSLLEQVAMRGVPFPSPLIMFSKVLFTLDGILEEIRGTTAELTIAQYLLRRWARHPLSMGVPLTLRDWIGVECNLLLYATRMGVCCEEALAHRITGKLGADASAA